MGLEVPDRGLHHLRRGQDERQLHLASPEQLSDFLHAGQQILIDDRQTGLGGQRLIQVVGQTLGLSVDDPPAQPLIDR